MGILLKHSHCSFIVQGLIFIFLSAYCTHLELDDYWFVSSQVLTKEKLPDGDSCADSNGNVYTHLQTWSEDNTCSQYKCYEVVSGNFLIKSTCREPLQAENPDSVNCDFVGNDTAAYPHCCPVLHCPEDQVYNITTVTGCADRASNFSCSVWKQYDGCNTTSKLYNFTSIYCQKSCKFCS